MGVVYRGVNLEDATKEWLTEEIRASHASYLFVTETQADTEELFRDMTGGTAFETETLYAIVDDGKELRLQKAGENNRE